VQTDDTVQVPQLSKAAVEQVPIFDKHPDEQVVHAVPAVLQVVQAYVVFVALQGVNKRY